MTKQMRIIKLLDNMYDLIKECPELFHDGIDEDLIDYVNAIKSLVK